MDRKLRTKARKDYKKLHRGETDNLDMETETDHLELSAGNEDEFEGDEESTGGGSSEEGEVHSPDADLNLNNSDLDVEIQKAIEDDDEERAQVLMDEKERRCEELKEEVQREQGREEENRRKRMREMQSRFKNLKKAENSLNKSLASSRASTPTSSPPSRHTSRSPTTGKVEKRGTQRKSPTQTVRRTHKRGMAAKPGKAQKNKTLDYSEYNTFLTDMIDAKGGKSERFNELLSKVIIESNNGENFKNVGQRLHRGTMGEDGLRELLDAVKQTKETNAKLKVVGNNNNSDNDALENKNDNRKLVSGKCAKPDETDIQVVVKFAHKKLDPRHVLDRNFDHLSFNQLVAGELELIARRDISELERDARIQIAKTICYHKQYLSDADLRSGYDTILKNVEKGIEPWSPMLGEKLHQLFDYRALSIMREKMQSAKIEANPVLPSNEGKGEKRSPDKTGTGTEEEANRPIFCMEYNQGTCNHTESHEGNFAGKKTIKWHICRKCRRMGFIAHHTEKECNRK